MPKNRCLLTGLIAAALLCTVCGCPGTPGGGGGSAKTGGGDSDLPGVDMKKVSVGLPSRTLDFIGSSGFSLAGAREGGKVYFGVETPNGYEMFERDLTSFKRRSVMKTSLISPGTMTSGRAGEWLFYCRSREIEKYIDKPEVYNAPQDIGLVYRVNSASGKEESLFDFRDPAFIKYRKSDFLPFCSPDGSRACVLSFDYDRSMIARQCDEWLAYDKATYSPPQPLKAEEIAEREKDLRSLFEAGYFKPLVQAQGLSIPASGKITDAERAAVKKILADNAAANWALLLWSAGKASAIPLKIPAGFEDLNLVMQGISNQVSLVSAMKDDGTGTPYWHLFVVNEADGTLSEVARYAGLPSTMQISADESAVLLVYTPYDAAKKQMAATPVVRTIPLDGSAPSDKPLPGRFTNFLDMSEDGKSAVAQNASDNDLYYIDIEAGSQTLLTRLASEVGGLFYSPAARCAVYLENGILFAVKIEDQPEQSPDWITDSYFAQVQSSALEFFKQAGFSPPAELDWEWEERVGMGVHQFAAVGNVKGDPAKQFLLRYDADAKRVESAWFPNGYPFPVIPELQGGNLDVVDCSQRVEEELERLGWLSETKQKYAPDGTPIYDDRTKSYVIVFRDGYELSDADKQWVFNAEATLRINKDTGEILEFNLTSQEPVQGQKFAITAEEALVAIRNYKQQPIPEEAPIKFDTENYRLVLVKGGSLVGGPAKYLEPLDKPRLCYEIDGRLQPEDVLILTTQVDTETAEVLGQLSFLPSNQQREMGL